jgi:hypothetical protein
VCQSCPPADQLGDFEGRFTDIVTCPFTNEWRGWPCMLHQLVGGHGGCTHLS